MQKDTDPNIHKYFQWVGIKFLLKRKLKNGFTKARKIVGLWFCSLDVEALHNVPFALAKRYIYVGVCIYTYMYIYMCVYIYLYASHTHIYYIYVCIYINMCVCVYSYVYTYEYIYIYREIER